MKKNISYNRTAIVNQGGQVSSITISRAIEIGTVDKNITTASLEEDEDYRPDCFYVIPPIEGGDTNFLKYITEYNVSIHHPSSGIDGSNRYTLEGAIVQVPEDIRMVGLKVSFLNNSGLVETWEFAGGVFENIENWKSNEDKLTDIRDEAISKNKGS